MPDALILHREHDTIHSVMNKYIGIPGKQSRLCVDNARRFLLNVKSSLVYISIFSIENLSIF